MNCKHCKRCLPENAIYCPWCGEKQIKERKKAKDEIKIPAAVKRGCSWNIYLRAEKVSITESTKALCEAKARAIRAGYIDQKKVVPKITVKAACEAYIERRRVVLSPSTIRGYTFIARDRFCSVAASELATVDWQRVINAEAENCAPKTLKNAWGFISAVLRENGLPVPSVSLPQIVKKDEPWLDYIQIQKFLQAVNGKECELPALLALHGLRSSELMNVTSAKIDRRRMKILVEGSVVRSMDGYVAKETNKNQSSRREVDIVIPRLLDLIPSGASPDEPLVSTHPNTLRSRINSVCRSCSLPLVGVHGLRRSFASLCYHLGVDMLTTMRLGGWSDDKICREIYTKLAASDVNSNVEKLRKYYNFTAEFTADQEKP